jgi:hypothetical protein
MCLRWFCFFDRAFLLLGYRSVSLPLEKQLETARKRRERERERERGTRIRRVVTRRRCARSIYLFFSLFLSLIENGNGVSKSTPLSFYYKTPYILNKRARPLFLSPLLKTVCFYDREEFFRKRLRHLPSPRRRTPPLLRPWRLGTADTR